MRTLVIKHMLVEEWGKEIEGDGFEEYAVALEIVASENGIDIEEFVQEILK